MTNPPAQYRGRYDRWRVESYPRIAPALATITLLVAILASAGVVILTKVQGDEQARRAEAISGVLDCFDTYAERSAATSKEVRVASADVSAAQASEARRSVVWTDLLIQGLAYKGGDTSPQARRIIFRFAAATTNLKRAQADLVAAQKTLAKVRDANPVPDPPSTFCNVTP